MDATRWESVCATFEALVELEPSVRHVQLAAVAATDPDLRRAVQLLLDADANAAAQIAARLAPLGLAPPVDADDAARDLRRRLETALAQTYRIEREIPGGGSSRVFAAVERSLGRHVAIKVLPPELDDPSYGARFEREMQLVARLQHPHIVPLFASGAVDGMPYFTMPLIEGESLRARLQREGRLPIADCTRILLEIADALAYAGAHGVVHRDVKPGNILLSDEHALLADFGVARARGVAAGTTHATAQGIVLGTPIYMAPEQWAGERVDARADLYSLGVVGYEMLTGRPPFPRDTIAALLAAHATEPPPPIASVRADVPPALDALVMRCLEKRPEDRWQGADELLRQLRRLAASDEDPRGEHRSLPKTPRALGRPALRPTSIVTALLVVAALTVAGIRLAQQRAARVDRSVAVLTFATIGGDTGATYIAQGLADGVASSLGEVKRLTVVSRIAVRRLADPARLSSAQIGATLHAAQLVSGSVQRDGSHLRVTVELVRARSGEQLWSARFDTTTADVLGIQAAVSEAVAQHVAGQLLSNERLQVARRPTASAEAYDHYLRGNRLLQAETEPAVLGAIAEYETALEFDSTFVSAMGRLAFAYGLSLNWAYRPGGLPPDSILARGMRLADRAIGRDSSASDAWMGRGAMLLFRGSPADFAAGADAFRHAVALDPTNDAAHHWLGAALRRLGQFDEAALEYHRALSHNPARLQSMADLGFIAFSQRSYDVAASWYLRCNALDSTVAATHSMIAMARSFAGDRAGGLREGRIAMSLAAEIERPRAFAMLAELEERAGDHPRALAHLRDALREVGATADALPATLGVRSWWQIGAAAATVGQRDLALTILERIRPRGPWLWSYLIFEDFDAVRADPRFRAIVDEARPRGVRDPIPSR